MSSTLHDERWAAWIAKGARADARARTQMRTVLAVLCLALLINLTWTLW
jgi:hypothetical protein